MDINLTGMTWIHILCQNPLTDSGSKVAHLNLIGWFKITVAVNPAKRCHRLSCGLLRSEFFSTPKIQIIGKC